MRINVYAWQYRVDTNREDDCRARWATNFLEALIYMVIPISESTGKEDASLPKS